MIRPACDGTEQPFTVNGVRVLYCFDDVARRHFYLNLDTDIELSLEDYQRLIDTRAVTPPAAVAAFRAR